MDMSIYGLWVSIAPANAALGYGIIESAIVIDIGSLVDVSSD